MKPDTYKNYYSKGQDIHFRMTTPEEETELFKRAKKGDETAREFLITNHLLFAAMQAQQLVAGRLPKDEVISAANYAVMKAYQKFDPSLGYRFTTYLRPFIRGEVSSLWKSKFTGNVPDPSISTAAGYPDMSTVQEIYSFNCNNGSSAKSSVGRFYDFEDHPGERLDLEKFNREVLGKVLARLSKRDQKLIHLVYVDGLSFADIARQRGVSRAAVQATHARLLKRLKRALKSGGIER